MKRSNDSRSAILKDDNGEIFGLVLAGNHTAEHEFGIQRMQDSLRIKAGSGNFEDYCSKISGHYKMAKKKARPKAQYPIPESIIITNGYPEDIASYDKMLFYNEEIPFSSAWNESHFIVKGYSEDAKNAIKLIAEGFEKADIAIWTGGSRLGFNSPGLVIVRASRVPESMVEQFNANQQAAKDLKEAALKTGIEEKIVQAKNHRVDIRYGSRAFYALVPAWISEERKKDSTHPVVFFLNPGDQKNNNFGWFTVEELEQWLEGKGPVIKQAA